MARVFGRALAAVCLAAWVSLGAQLETLVGERGLTPAGETVAAMRAAELSIWEAPTLFWWTQSQAALTAGVVLGALLAVLAIVGPWQRACFALTAPLYLSYAEICGSFTAFQWDNMLVESTLLAAFLPTDRRAPLAHFALRVLLFKLYLESGIAKWQSHLHDWQDGSAMTFYYETAPIPTRLAWYAHQLPEGWHHLESWGALVLELLVPFLIWGPRRARLLAFASFTGFQIVNTATANYGFFTYLSLTLHLFLLSDRDVTRITRGARAWLRLPRRVEIRRPASPTNARWRGIASRALLASYVGASVVGGLVHFSASTAMRDALADVYGAYEPFRVANVYHLFGHITRERIEPELQTLGRGGWTAHALRFKPGPPERAPPFVAPHQPRVDFRLWFYGLGFRRGMPPYVRALLDRMCHAPAAVQPLFDARLPASPEAVRIAFYRYHFTTPAQRAATGEYWSRERLGELRPIACKDGMTP